MKMFWMIACCSGWTCAVYFGYQLTMKKVECSRLLYLQEIDERKNDLLEDEVNELTYTLQQSKTYDEGFMDAMLRRESAEYVNGYHTAVSQMLEAQKLNEEFDSKKANGTSLLGEKQ